MPPVDHRTPHAERLPSAAAREMTAARTRHQLELDAINQQLALFVQQHTQHIQHTLTKLTPTHSHTTPTQPTAQPPQPTLPPSHALPALDDILPPPPQPRRPASRPVPPTAAQADSAMDGGDEDDVECDAYGVLIRRRRSKLPLRSVLALRTWFAEHLQAPYPTDAQRDELAQHTQLTAKQVQNWFTNTRKRFWAPWVKRQQEAQQASGHTAASEDGSACVTFEGFSLQGS